MSSIFFYIPLSSFIFLLKDCVEYPAQFLRIHDEVSQLGEIALVIRAGNPKSDISMNGILVVEMLTEPLPLLLAVQIRIIRQSILDRSAEDR